MDVDSDDNVGGGLKTVLPSSLVADAANSSGGCAHQVFGFTTPKSSRRMLLKAFGSTPQRVRGAASAGAKPGGSASRRRSVAQSGGGTPRASGGGTPRGGGKSSRSAPLSGRAPNTAQRLRTRNVTESASEDEEEEEPSADGSCSDEDSLGELEQLTLDDANDEKENRPAARTGRGEVDALRATVEDYFEVHSGAGLSGGASGKAPNTSNRTLSRLGDSRPDLDTVRRLLAATQRHVAARAALRERVRAQFPHWLEELAAGFNLVLHGLGSKRLLLAELSTRWLSRGARCVEVAGYHPACSLQQVLLALSEGVFCDASAARQPHELLQRLLTELDRADEHEPVYLVLHNMDGPLLRSSKAQDALSRLAATRRLRLLASVDHVNAALLWSEAAMGRLAWLWKHVPSLEPYAEETSFENSLVAQSGGALQLASMRRVMMSLTPNARGVYLLLARHQRAAAQDSPGLPLEELYRRCRDAFLVTSELNLQAQLTEFRDHKLVRLRKGVDGADLIFVPVDAGTLEEFLQDHEDVVV